MIAALRDMSVLVVEDNEDHAEFIVNALNKVNSRNKVHHVADGRFAMSYLDELQKSDLPDLVLMDIKMPRLDGISALRLIKSDPSLRRLPVVIVTTSSRAEDVENAYDAGASGVLKKPVNITQLQDKIESAINYWANTVELPDGES